MVFSAKMQPTAPKEELVDLYADLEGISLGGPEKNYHHSLVYLRSISPFYVWVSGVPHVLVSAFEKDLPKTFRVPVSHIYSIPFSLDPVKQGHRFSLKEQVLVHVDGVLWRGVVVRARGGQVSVRWHMRYVGYDHVETYPMDDVLPASYATAVRADAIPALSAQLAEKEKKEAASDGLLGLVN